MTLGILTAMQSEHDLLASLLENKHTKQINNFSYLHGTLGTHEVILLQCGIGKVNAAIGTVELIKNYAPSYIVSTGVAGGIDTCLSVMDVVVSEQTVYHDVWCGMGCDQGQIQGFPTFFQAAPNLVKAALSLNNTQTTKIHSGLICTGDQFITSRTELDTIKTNFPQGLAVDMESCAIAHTCHIYGVPFVSFRIISDTPGVDEHIQQYEDFWGEMASRSFQVTKHFLEAITN
jgi:adenosylhomocysteine nucleosidase